MNILLAFKAEPDAGMLAEKSGRRRLRVIADRMFHYCEVYSVLMNRPQLRCCWRREKWYSDVFNRVEHGG